MDAADAVAFKTLLTQWPNLGAEYEQARACRFALRRLSLLGQQRPAAAVAAAAAAVDDCKTANANVQCFPSQFANAMKRNRLRFLRAVDKPSLRGNELPKVIGSFKFL